MNAVLPTRTGTSRYGPGDEAGSFNEATHEGVVRAAQLVRGGRVFDLSHVIDRTIPAFPGRTFKQVLTTTAHQRLLDKWKSLLETMQCRDEYFEAGHYAGGRNTIEGVSHQNGTVRFGTDPTTSALDINCKMHDVDKPVRRRLVLLPLFFGGQPDLDDYCHALRVAQQIDMRIS